MVFEGKLSEHQTRDLDSPALVEAAPSDIGMLNAEGRMVDMYIPRKCSATNSLIGPKDHASVQINVGHVDSEGRYISGKYQAFAFCGKVRSSGKCDQAFTALAQEMGLLREF